MDVKECIYCGEAVELADDGAWQGVEDGACGCMASVEQGGEGEHEPAPDVAAGERGYLYCGGGSDAYGYE